MVTPYRVAVFAHNEELTIVPALNSILAACHPPRDLKIFVLINGCTDRTPHVVKNFAREHDEVIPVEISIGDKCNAWNTYVYDYADESPCHFFMDGDVTCSPNAIANMQMALLANGTAMAIAGIPLSGRHRQNYLRYIKEWHWLFGNLYAAKSDQLLKLRNAKVRLPLGLLPEDHLISKFMAARNLAPTDFDWQQNIYHPDAGYCFRSLQWYRWRDCWLYWRRRVRYTLADMHTAEVDDFELHRLPTTMDAINRSILARLESASLLRADMFTRAVRRRLRQMYPASDTPHFDKLLSRSNHANTKVVAR